MSAVQVNEVNMSQFKECVMFSIKLKRWGNRAAIKDPKKLAMYLGMMEKERKEAAEKAAEEGEQSEEQSPTLKSPPTIAEAKKRNVSASKRLIQSTALDNLNERMNKAKRDSLSLSMPSFIREGIFVVRREMVQTVDGILTRANEEIAEEYLPAFQLEYPSCIASARDAKLMKGGLGPLFDGRDYPEASLMSEKFGINWNWLSLTLPENGLPPELRQREAEKLERVYSDASKEIKMALRVMFADLLKHATERLAIQPGEAPKKFRDGTLGNLVDFFDTFEARNLMNDDALAEVVNQCKQVMVGVTSDKMRKDFELRNSTATALQKIKDTLDPLIETEERAFDFDED